MKHHSYGVIYKITNLINNKVYIGQTIQKPNVRWNQHVRDSKKIKNQMIISKAINKYGKNNFNFELMCTCFNQKELNKQEEFFINRYNCLVPNGYNLDAKSTGCGRKHPETIAKMKLINGSKKRRNQSKINGKKSKNRLYKNNSRFLGVFKHQNGWQVSITYNSKNIYIGKYKTEIEAAKARDLAIIKFCGTKEKLNFPELLEDYIKNKIKPEKLSRRFSKPPKNKKSESNVIGVYYDSSRKKWGARKGNIPFKRFNTKLEAEDYILNYENRNT